jgi:hypothetical protein
MATSMNFSSLLVDLRRYLERGSAVDTTVFEQLPRLINNAEREIARDLKIEGFITNVISSLSAGVSTYLKPDRWRETISMNFGTGTDQNTRVSLYPRSYEYARTYWPNSSDTDTPEFYSDYDYTHWLIVPTPIIDYPWEINYYQLLPLLDDVVQTNWLTNFAPTTLLYRCLLECTPFLKNDDRIPVWQGIYAQSRAALNGEDLQKILDRTSTRQEA